MSKKKKSKKKKTALPKKRKKNYKSLIITLAVILAAAAAAAVSYCVYYFNSPESAGFVGKTYKCLKAYDASGDEAHLQDVYNVRYDAYQGSMTLNNDGTFSFWMKPGSADDGEHGGKYTYNKDKDIINATFGNNEKVKFKIARNADGSVEHIEVPYQGYTVYMSE